MTAPGGQAFVESIALQTGELFETRELTADGRAPRFSPDDAFIAYETGLEVSRRIKVVRNDASHTEVLDIPGVSATFSSSTPEVAYLKIPDHADIRRVSDALDKASLTAANRTQLTQELTWLIAKHATIVVRDLNNGREMELPAPELVKTGLTFLTPTAVRCSFSALTKLMPNAAPTSTRSVNANLVHRSSWTRPA